MCSVLTCIARAGQVRRVMMEHDAQVVLQQVAHSDWFGFEQVQVGIHLGRSQQLCLLLCNHH